MAGDHRETEETATGFAGVIRRELRTARALAPKISAAGRPLITSGPKSIRAWWDGISSWFAFVHRRRIDSRFPVFPKPIRIAELLAVFLSVLALLLLFADPVYLTVVSRADWAPNDFFEIVTEFGRSDWVLYPAGAALIVYSVFRQGGMMSRSAHIAHTGMLAIYYVFTAVAFSGIIAAVLKNLIGRARPEFVTPGNVWESFPFRDSYDFASFPSGHATTAGALTVALALLFPRMRILFLIIGIWIAISRPALAVHFPSDVFAGFCLGAAFSYHYARSFARKRLLFGFDQRGGVLPRFRLPRLRIPGKRP